MLGAGCTVRRLMDKKANWDDLNSSSRFWYWQNLSSGLTKASMSLPSLPLKGVTTLRQAASEVGRALT